MYTYQNRLNVKSIKSFWNLSTTFTSCNKHSFLIISCKEHSIPFTSCTNVSTKNVSRESSIIRYCYHTLMTKERDSSVNGNTNLNTETLAQESSKAFLIKNPPKILLKILRDWKKEIPCWFVFCGYIYCVCVLCGASVMGLFTELWPPVEVASKKWQKHLKAFLRRKLMSSWSKVFLPSFTHYD